SMVLTRFKDLDPNAASLERTFTEAAFLDAVRRSKEYIFAGDCMQVQISQRTSRPFEATPLSLYRALRGLNPSPYMFYFDFNDHHVVGASPEILVRLSAGTITLRPIAGTRPRGRTPEEDAAVAEELLADPKKRGVYSGAVGYLGFNGDMDVAIAIRTAVIKDRRLHVQAAAGIVADSVPNSEWQETQHKARAILRAAEVASAEAA